MAETHQEILKVWIAPGCIVCDSCETDCPEVFEVQEETCIIRPEALTQDFTKPLTPSIIVAAEGCPVDVIKYDTVEVEGPEPWAGQEEQAAEAAPAAGGVPAAKKAASVIPEGPPIPRWAGLLSAAHTSGSRSAGGPAVTVRPLARAPAEAIAAILPRNAPPDAVWAAGVGSGFVRPRPSIAKRIKDRASGLSRRDFSVFSGVSVVLSVAWGSLVAVGGVLGGALQSFMVPKVTKEPPSTFRVGRLSDFPEPGVYESYKSKGVWVVRLQKGKLVALSTTCTHLGCIPNWFPTDRKFKCPCHGSGFYVSGVNFEGPAPRPLERIKIYMAGEFLMVDKSVKFRQELGQWSKSDSYVMV